MAKLPKIQPSWDVSDLTSEAVGAWLADLVDGLPSMPVEITTSGAAGGRHVARGRGWAMSFVTEPGRAFTAVLFDEVDRGSGVPSPDYTVTSTYPTAAAAAAACGGPSAEIPGDTEVEVRHYIGVLGSGLRMSSRLAATRAQWARSAFPDPRTPMPLGRWKHEGNDDGPLLYPVSAEVAAAFNGPMDDEEDD